MADEDGDGLDDDTGLPVLPPFNVIVGSTEPAPPAPIGFREPLFGRGEEPVDIELRGFEEAGPAAAEEFRRTVPAPVQGGYYDSDLDQIVAGIAGSPASTASVQQAMVAAGLIKESAVITFGQWGNSETTAFAELLAMSNRSGRTWDVTLNNMLRSGGVAADGGGGGGTGRRFVARPPNRGEVKRAYRNLRQRSLGGQFTREDDEAFKAEQEAFANAFEAQVVGAQRAAFDGRSVESPPSLEAAALDKIETEQKAGVEAFSFAGLASAMTQALGR